MHLAIKKLGRFKRLGHRVTGDRQAGRSRGVGWDDVHVAIDDHSRISQCHALARPAGRERGTRVNRLDVHFKRVLTDNGACYRSRVFTKACR